MRTDGDERRLTPQATGLVEEFLRLNRRRRRRNPALSDLEHQRWLDLRWRIEEVLDRPHARRRGPPRKSLRVPSRYQAEFEHSPRRETATVRVIGEGGLFIATERPLAVRTPLRLELTGDAGESLEVEGAVVWIRRRNDGGEPAGMGVRFEGLDDAQREAVSRLVESALAAL